MAHVVSVIIVAFNQKEMLLETIDSLLKQTYPDLEIIVVDNNSMDGTSDLIKTERPQVSYIKSEVNLGFAGGNNLGLEHSSGEYIALLNSDAVAQADWLEALTAAMDTHPDVGICASKMIAFGTEVIDSAGDGFSTILKGFKRGEGESPALYDKEEYIFGACAGAALYRRKMLDEIGFLDEDFFLIHEDTDLNFRAQLTGWKVLYVPKAIVYHKVRSTIGNMSDVAIYHTLRNCEFVRLKNIPLVVFLGCLPAYIFGAIADFFYFAVRHRKLKLYFNAKSDAVKMMKMMCGKRKKIMTMKRGEDKYLYRMMTPVWSREFFSAKAKKFFGN